MNLAVKILIGLVLGAIAGLVLNLTALDFFTGIADPYIFEPLGTIFLNLINLLVVPIVLFSIILGVAGLGDTKKMGRIATKTIVFFLSTTAIAIIISIILAVVIQPGSLTEYDTTGATFEAKEAPPVWETLINIIPKNPFEAMATGNILQIIAFAILIGFGLVKLGDKTAGLLKLVEQGNDLVMYLVMLVMKFAPYGTFGLIASAIGSQGMDAIRAMGMYMIVVVAALILQLVIVYSGAIYFLAKQNPWKFIKGFAPAMGIAFSTSSSNATLPVSMDVAQKRLGVSKSVSSFVQPLGATINMDGTAIMQGVATVFIAQAFNVDLSFGEYAIVVLTAVLASIGTAGVPGVGLILLATVLQSVNLPVEGIALILGVDRLLDMSRTALNITGDATCAVIVQESEDRRKEKLNA